MSSPKDRRVVLVEPGVTRTSFEENLTRPDQPLPLYASVRVRQEALMRDWIKTGDVPEVVANTVVKAATAAAPNRRYPASHRERRRVRDALPSRQICL